MAFWWGYKTHAFFNLVNCFKELWIIIRFLYPSDVSRRIKNLSNCPWIKKEVRTSSSETIVIVRISLNVNRSRSDFYSGIMTRKGKAQIDFGWLWKWRDLFYTHTNLDVLGVSPSLNQNFLGLIKQIKTDKKHDIKLKQTIWFWN